MTIHTGFVRDEAAIQHSTPLNKPGMARAGSLKEISKPVSIMHLASPLKNATSGTFQNAGVETAPMSSANLEREIGAFSDLFPLESSRYVFDHKSSGDPCQVLERSGESSRHPRSAWDETANVFERCHV